MEYLSNVATSDTMYHSFNDIELIEPASPPRKTATSTIMEIKETKQPRRLSGGSESSEDGRPPTSVQMKRQDSGYESHTTSPRTSISHPRPSPPPRRRTSMSVTVGSSARPRTRPSTRRSTKSYHHPNSSSVHVVHPLPQSIQSSYFHFPSPDPETDANQLQLGSSHQQLERTPPTPVLEPPQTVHYWTCDRTRRLEYAAIDAASRGVKGWIRRHLLPDCLAARDGGRHIAFDDDTGSVRRYRLELEDEQLGEEKSPVARGTKAWQFWKNKR